MPAPIRGRPNFLPRRNCDAPRSFSLNNGFKQSAGEGARSGSAFLSFYRTPRSPRQFVIADVTKDSTDAILGGCTVKLYRVMDNAAFMETVSDPVTGAFSFSVPSNGWVCYAVAYKAGAPDVAGTTVNTLVGVAT